MKKSFLVLGLALIFLCSTIDFSDAQSSRSSGGRSGSSSFSGGGKSSSGSSSKGGWSSSSSVSKPSASPSTPSPSVSKPSASPSTSSGWSSSSGNKAVTPSPSVSKPSASPSTSSGWSSSSGNKATTPSDSSGKSAFSKAGSGPSYSPPKSTTGSSNWGGSSSRTYAPRYTPPSSSWTPRYYGSGGPVVINQGPGLGYSMFDLWWKFELLDTLKDRNERDSVIRELRSNPEYAAWKAEAAKLSDENEELKSKLNELSEESATIPDVVKENDGIGGWGVFFVSLTFIAIIGLILIFIIKRF